MNRNPFRRRRPSDRDAAVESGAVESAALTPAAAVDSAAVEAALRDSLARHAEAGPDPDALARRILAATDARAPRRTPEPAARGPWRQWGLPLVAAASVAAVVGVGAAIAAYHPDRTGPQAATQAPASPSAPAPVTSTVTVTSTPDASSPASVSVQQNTSKLHHVRVRDLTFTGAEDGYGLASADCIAGPGTCVALLQTVDGTSWTSHPNTPFDVPGISAGCPARRCVEHIRFATSEIGYVYGPDALFMTTDGAQTWLQLAGGADALETLDNNVIRVSHRGSCTTSCTHTVQTAAIGSAGWSTVDLPGDTSGTGVSLSRGGSEAYVLLTRTPAVSSGGNASDPSTTLLRSADDGASWAVAGSACSPRGGSAVDARAAAAGSDGAVSVLCGALSGSRPWSVAVSTDAGRTFSARAGQLVRAAVDPAGQDVLAGDPSTVLVLAGDGLSRSTDGARSWQAVPDVAGTFGFVGFESATVGRALSTDGRVIWTTRDAGRTWQASTLG